jgi:hypothetical protein
LFDSEDHIGSIDMQMGGVQLCHIIPGAIFRQGFFAKSLKTLALRRKSFSGIGNH